MALPLQFAIDFFRTTTGCNAREHHMARARRVKQERARVATALWLQAGSRGVLPGDPSAFRRRVGPPPYVVTLTRIGPRLADDENAASGLKGVRDEIGDWLGTGDAPTAPVRWVYAQERGRFAVRIRIESAEEAAA